MLFMQSSVETTDRKKHRTYAAVLSPKEFFKIKHVRGNHQYKLLLTDVSFADVGKRSPFSRLRWIVSKKVKDLG